MKCKKQRITIGILTILCVFLISNKVQAAASLQSNGANPVYLNVNDWLTRIRQMQAPGGTLGLTDEISETNLTSENKDLDIHMQKNTEYGAMTILATSSYGNPNTIENGETTTGNKTGVVMYSRGEWTSASLEESGIEKFQIASKRYKDIYTTDFEQKKVGDANELYTWRNSCLRWWIDTNQAVLRTYDSGIFAIGHYTPDYFPASHAYARYGFTCRAVVITGSGI